MTLGIPTETKFYLVTTDVHPDGFSPMIVAAKSKRRAAKKAARIWTGATALFVLRLHDDFEEYAISRDQLIGAASTATYYVPRERA